MTYQEKINESLARAEELCKIGSISDCLCTTDDIEILLDYIRKLESEVSNHGSGNVVIRANAGTM